MDLIGAKVDGVSGDNWSYKTHKVLRPSTKQHCSFLLTECPSALSYRPVNSGQQSTVSGHWKEQKMVISPIYWPNPLEGIVLPNFVREFVLSA